MRLKENLKRFGKEINAMIKELDKALKPKSGLLENGVARKQCLAKLKKLIKEIEETIDKQEHGVWIE